MATTVATLQARQPPASPRLFYTTDDIKQAILTKCDAEEPFCLRFPVKSGTRKSELDKMISTLPIPKTIRRSYTVADGFMVRWMPSCAHQCASRAFIRFLDAVFNQVLQEPDTSQDLFVCFGSATQRIKTPNKEWKQADECFGHWEAHSPSVVLEVGPSEHSPELHTDMMWWLTSVELKVKLVVIIVIAPGPPPPNSTSNEPRITVEHWEMVAEADDHGPVPTKVYAGDWTHAVPNEGDYQVPTDAFVPDSATRAQFNLPPFLSPKTKNMEMIRRSILSGWRLDNGEGA